MYDEYERALGGGGKGRGRSGWVWFLAAFGFFALTGVVAAGLVIQKGVGAARERLASFDVGSATDGIVDRLHEHTALLRAEPVAGLEFLRSLDPEEPSRTLVGDLLPREVQARERRARGADDDRRTFTFRAGEEELRIDFDRDEDGGSLVIGSQGETVRFDLFRTEDGGFLTIDDGEEEARVDLVRTSDGGRLTIDTPDGQVRLDLTEGEDGGSLVVRTDRDEVLRLGLGQDARAMPRWVPRRSAMPATPEPVYSLTSDDGFLGAVAWNEEASAGEVVDFYAGRLEDEGFRLESEAQDRGGAVERNALWARSPDSERFVFVLAQDDGESTRVLLGFGEGR